MTIHLTSRLGRPSRHPDELYKNGIQRSSFVPCIELLKERFEVTDLDSGTGEYSRLRICIVPADIGQTTAAYHAHCRTSTMTP